jgi:flavin prenyltransferase
MNIFLGITGASGGPYAARLLDALLAADVEVGLCVSRAGYEILATELYEDVSLSNEQILDRFVAGKEGVKVHSEQDWRAPYASGSARVDGYVVCPCSMGTAGTIAAGTMSNLIHRAASVALKEGRKLVLVPRETPLSDIHLENLLRLRRAGAVVLMAAPGFYNAPRTIDDLIEFVVGRCLDQLGIENRLTRRWGQE